MFRTKRFRYIFIYSIFLNHHRFHRYVAVSKQILWKIYIQRLILSRGYQLFMRFIADTTKIKKKKKYTHRQVLFLFRFDHEEGKAAGCHFN